MNLSFDLYKVFYYVCQYKSITEAAKNLYVSQPAITKQIHNLENSLNKTLFVRTKKGLEMTREGKELYEQIKDSIEQLTSIENNVGEGHCVIRIIAGYSTIKNFLIKNLSRFNELYPNVIFEVSSCNYYESIERLKNGQADLIFLNMKNCVTNDLNDFVVKKCYEVQDVFVVSKDYLGNIPSVLKLLDLNQYPIICKSGSSVARKNIEEIFQKNNQTFHPKYELSNNWLIEEYVRLNLGIGLVTKEFTMKEITSGEFLEVPTDLVLPKREIGYAVRKNFIYNHFIHEFIRTIQDIL